MEKKFMGFIGTGNMGGALARAAAVNVAPEQILLSNRHPEKADIHCRIKRKIQPFILEKHLKKPEENLSSSG